MNKFLSFLCIITFLWLSALLPLNAQSYETEVFTGESYSTASYVGFSHGHRSNLYKDNNGTLHLAVVDNYKLKYLTSSDEGMSWQEQSITSEFDGKVSNAMIKGNGNGDLFLALDVRPGYNYGNSISSSYYFWRHIYVYKNTGGVWQKEAIETPGSTMGGKVIRDLLVAEDGTVHLITIYSGWYDYGGKAYEFRRNPDTGEWQTITIANYNDTSIDKGFGFFSSVMQGDGSIAGLYWRNKGSGELGYRVSVGGTWGAPVVISSDANYYLDICRHSDGSPRIVYTTKSSPQKIMYKSVLDNSPGEEIWTLAEGQTVNAVNVHSNSIGKETIIIGLEGERTIYAEKYPGDVAWPTTFQQVPLIEDAHGLSTVSSSSDALVNFSCTYIDYKKNGTTGPHGPNIRYFFNIPDTRTLSLEASPQEGGSVTGGGDFLIYSTQTIEATPEVAYEFIQWSENGRFISADAQSAVEVYDNRTLTAEFQPTKDYKISLLVNEPVHGNISGAGTYSVGENVTINATPDEGYHFVNWTESGIEVSTLPEYSFVASGDKMLTANFEINQYSLTTEVNNALYGSSTGDGIYNYGTEASVEALPGEGYGFSHWESNSVFVSSDNPLIVVMIADKALTAVFKEQYAITAAPDPVGGGIIEGVGDYLIGETVTITAVAEQLYSFSHWTEEGSSISNEVELSFTVTGARTLTAHFVPWFAGGTGTSEDPYLIETPEHLNNVRNFLEQSGVHFRMIGDIDLNVAPYNEGNGWLPIGDDYYNAFRGNFDGAGYSIMNLFSNRSIMNVGLFGLGQSATVKNLNLTNINLTGNRRVGGIFGAHYYGTTINCSVEGVIVAGDFGGGIAGRDMGSISNCFVNVTVSGDYVGSLVGYKDNGSANNCYGTGTITTSYIGGGLIGHLSSSTINNSYSLAQVNGAGGLVGYVYSSYTINNSYFSDTEPNNNVGEAINKESMRCSQTFTEWDFSTVWDIQPDKNNGYPFLRWQTPETTPVIDLTDFSIDGDDLSLSVGDTYQLTVTFTPTDATLQCIDWSTSNEAVATITPTGSLEVIGPGSATLSAYHSGLDVTKSITVTGYYQIDVLSDPVVGGTITGGGQYENNAAVSLTATANSGYAFTEWSEDGTILTSVNPFTFSATGNRTITAHFVPVHNIIVQPSVYGSVEILNGENEVILPDNETTGSYIIHENENVHIKSIPGIGYHFVEWQEAGISLSTDNPYALTVSEDRTFTAVLEINTYSLVYVASENGSISGTTPQIVEHGQDAAEVTAVPNQGYHFVQWSDGLTTAARTDLAVNGDVNLTAEFAINTYNLVYVAGENGIINGTTPQIVEHGQDAAEVTAIPNQGYHFVQWSDGLTTASRTDMAVNGNVNVAAEFAINKWAVTFKVTMDGQVVENALIQIEGVGEEILTNNAGEATIHLPNGSYTYQVKVNALPVRENALLVVDDMDVFEAVVLTTTSMAHAEQSSIKVWPNPATKYVFVEGVLKISKVEIFNMDGSLIYSTGMQNNSVDISHLSTGIYIFRITDLKGSVISQRIIKK